MHATPAPVAVEMPVALTLSRASARAGAVERMTVRLVPVELGSVTFDIRTGAGGLRDIRIAVEKPETLALLQQDRRQLEQVFSRAGISAEPGQIQMTLMRNDDGDQAPTARAPPQAAGWITGDPTGGNATGGDPGARRHAAPVHAMPNDAPSAAWAPESADPRHIRLGTPRARPGLDIVA